MGTSSDDPGPVAPRRRHAVGMALLVLGLAAYALAAMVAGSALMSAHWLAQFAFFAVAGLAWLWPARRLLAWMARDG
jgi:hypothetical protein